MKIVTLNTWGGRAGKENLLAFFEQYKDSVDIFCLQEIWRAPYEHLEGVDMTQVVTDGLQEISRVLSDFQVFFHPHHQEDYGLATFVRSNRNVYEQGDYFVHKYKEYVPIGNVGKHARNIQYIKIGEKENPLTVINFHGLWNGAGKEDTEERILQSENIIQFLKEQKGRIVFCGDFNLLPETQSLRMMEDFGLHNLVREFGITSTRTSFYTKPEKFADYIFTSSNVAVKDFQVLPEEVSDHAALLVEIEEN